MLKILLISVGIDNKYGTVAGSANQHRVTTPMLSLPFIAANLLKTKEKEVELQIIDEYAELLDPRNLPEADIVGLSGMTMHANRMYLLADAYRKMGTYVVLGGIHVSFMTEEALQHADTIMIGEAEYTFVDFVNDFQKNNRKKYTDPQNLSISAPYPEPVSI